MNRCHSCCCCCNAIQWFLLILVINCSLCAAAAASLGFSSSNDSLDDIRRQVDQSSDDVKQIIDYVLTGAGRHVTFNRLAYISDTFGNRQIGSKALEQVLDFAVEEMNAEGFSNVHKERVTVPLWVRGKEHATLILPRRRQSMPMLGLGSSVGTNGSVLEADVIVVDSFDELNATSADEVKGKIVVYNEPWMGYDGSVEYRMDGASKAAAKGAVAALVRSATPFSLASPHTGVQVYSDGVTKIPVACITIEDAEMMRRIQDRGEKFRVQLYMEAENKPDGISYNVGGEIPGSEYPNETVILGGHIDSWDVGTGSLDDGGGVMIAWQVLSIVKKLGLHPRRTLRVVLWTAEEPDIIGSKAYFAAHRQEVNSVSMIMESDMGTFRPNGIRFSGSLAAVAIIVRALSVLAPYNASSVEYGKTAGESSDTSQWVEAGVPGVELFRNESNDRYFYFHHSNGDTMTALNADDMDLCTVVWATAAYTVASLDHMLPRTDLSQSEMPTESAEHLASESDSAVELIAKAIDGGTVYNRLDFAPSLSRDKPIINKLRRKRPKFGKPLESHQPKRMHM